MSDPRIVEISALALARLIRSGEAGAVEVFEAFRGRVDALNPALNAIVRFDPEIGRAQARESERRLRAGDPAPLLGVPFTVKDNLWVAGQAVSQGSRRFEQFRAPQDAFAVARLRAAGGVFLGITNCSEFACKGVTTNPLFGVTRNPYDLDRTPGGSSGGAASAVAAGFGPIALCTDGGGSTRRPASHTGVVGMKPTAGLVPHPIGFVEPVFGNAVVGQMARCVADVVALLDVLAQPSLADPQGLPLPVWSRAEADSERLPRDLRIAFSPRFGLDVPVDPDVAASVEVAVDRLAREGFRIERADPPWPEGAGEAALMPLQLAGLAALYGEALRRGEWDADPDIALQIEAGMRLTGADVAHALFARDALYRTFDAFFSDHDLVLTPTTPCTAWPWSQPAPREIAGQAVSPRSHAVFTPLINHCFLSAASVPCGLDRQGLPIGLQIVGPRFADARVLALAGRIEQQCPHDFSRPVSPPAAPTA
ncbi:amidase [Variovorax paradoxus]|nr:amidase [Variovorax paradoxus]MBT2303863.1 amidase [Variovorax paradoxus]